VASLASKGAESVKPGTAFGRHVLDIEVVIGDGSFVGYNFKVQQLSVKRGIPFGNLLLPVPVTGTGNWKTATSRVLSCMYPDGFKLPVYRSVISGKRVDVPCDPVLRGHLSPSPRG